MKLPEMAGPAESPPAEPWLVPCAIVRGGSSKGVMVREEHLPADPAARDALLLALMGSPDARQIDGLGGADPLTSKVAIVSPSDREGIDFEYESVEIGIAEARVTHGLMCGNLIAGAACFALADGLVKARGDSTVLRIWCRSNGKTIVARVPTGLGHDWTLPMAAGRACEVGLLFQEPAGAVTGHLLPAGEAVTRLDLDGRRIEASIVDAGTLYLFLRATDFGLIGDECPVRLENDVALRSTVEALRERAAAAIGLVRGTPLPARLVKVALVAPARPGTGDDVVARIINTARVHKAYAVSGGICLAGAAAIRGTLVNEFLQPRGSPFRLSIGHPAGSLVLDLLWSSRGDLPVIHAAEIRRSARILMRGTACVLPGATTAFHANAGRPAGHELLQEDS